MTIFEAIMIALTFGILIVELVKLVFIIVESVKK
ncbi:MAG: putative holin-like toxin [Defluviitaleaceae bacterium]|nr:putative holin-like toxin [Defluviitaleaceae bacterium]